MNKSIQNNALICIIFILILFFIYLLNYLTPESGDDFGYKYKIIGPLFLDKASPKISSIKDIIISQYNHYFIINGRAIVHFFVQLFSGLVGKDIFNIVNSIIFLVFICLLTKLTSNFKLSSLLLTFATTFLLFPSFGVTILWLSGAINYLWSSTLILGLLLLFQFSNTKRLKFNIFAISLFIYGIIAGWSHEGISMPLAASFILFYIFHRKEFIFKQHIFLIASFILGAIMVSLAPGTINRTSYNSFSLTNLLFYKFGALFLIFGELKAFYVFLLSLFIKYIMLKKKFYNWLKQFYFKNVIIAIALILSFLIVLISGKYEARVAIGIELYSMILLLKVIDSYKSKVRLFSISIFSCLAIILFSFVIKYSQINNKNVSNVLTQIQQTNNEIILFKDIKYHPLIAKYILIPSYLSNLIVNQNNFRENNRPYIFLPYNLFFDIISNSEKIMNGHEKIMNGQNIHQQKDYMYYVIRYENIKENVKPYFEMRKPYKNEIPIYYFPFSNKLDRFSLSEIEALQFQKIKINNNNYYIIAKNPMIDYRVNKIVFK